MVSNENVHRTHNTTDQIWQDMNMKDMSLDISPTMRNRGSMAPQLLFPKIDITRSYPTRRSTIDRDKRRASTKIWMVHVDEYDIFPETTFVTALPLLPQYHRRHDRYYSIM